MIFHTYLSRWIKAERKQRNLSQESMSKPLCVSTYPARHYRYSCLWHWNLQKLCRGQISLSSVNYGFSLFIFPGCWGWDGWQKWCLQRPNASVLPSKSNHNLLQYHLDSLFVHHRLAIHKYYTIHNILPQLFDWEIHNKDTEIFSDFPIFPRSFRQ